MNNEDKKKALRERTKRFAAAVVRLYSHWVQYPEACFGLVDVAASASEWTTDHSLALAATKIGKRDDGMIGGLIKCPGACSGDIYCSVDKRRGELEVLGKQMLRSGTSVAANYREASRSRSDAEFIAKIELCAQEADETRFWLELLNEECAFLKHPFKLYGISRMN